MGMFDNFIINTGLLPVTDEEKAKIGPNPGWQTKDFDNTLTNVYLCADGTLEVSRVDYGAVPKNERPYPDAPDDSFESIIGSVRSINERKEKIEYSGHCSFYADIDGDWYEFGIEFSDGRLVKIVGGKFTENG